MSEEFFENIRIPFIIQKYEDKPTIIPKELYMDFSTGKMYFKSIDGSTEIEVGRKTVENIIKLEIERIVGKSTTKGNTLKKLQIIIEPLVHWKEQMESVGYLSVSTISELLDVFRDMEESAPTLVAQLQNKVDKVEGLALSDNDFTNILFDKLEGIQPNANLYSHPEVQACNYVPPISYINGRTGDVVITKEELGLGNVQDGAKKYTHPITKQCSAVSINNVQTGSDSPRTGIVNLTKNNFLLDKVVNNQLITVSEINASVDGNLPANRYCTPYTFGLYLKKLKDLGKFNETQYKYVPKNITLTINTTPSDAAAKIMINNKTFHGKVHTVYNKTGYIVTVQKAGFETYEKYHYLNSDTNIVLNINLGKTGFNYKIILLTDYHTGAKYTLNIKNTANNTTVVNRLVSNSELVPGGVPIIAIIQGQLEPGTYSYTLTASHVGSPIIVDPGTFTIVDRDIETNTFSWFRANLENRFFMNNKVLDTLTQEGEGWRILIYDPGNTQISAGWRQLATAPSYETRSAIINKTGYKYAFIPRKYIYNNGTKMLVTNINDAVNDRETIIKDIDTSKGNCFIDKSTGYCNINRIDIVSDPCDILTHGDSNFGLFNNGRCERPSWLSGLTYSTLYNRLGFTDLNSSPDNNRREYCINPGTEVQLFKAMLNNKVVYINSYAPVTRINYSSYIVQKSLGTPDGITITHDGKSFKVKMFTGSTGAWSAGGDVSKMLPVLQQVSTQFPNDLSSKAVRWYKDYLSRIGQYGSIIMCRDTVTQEDWVDSYKVILTVQRCGAHGMHAMPKGSTIDPHNYYGTATSLAGIQYSISIQPGYWFYIEEI